MKQTDKLIFKEILPATLLGLLVLTFIAFTREFQRFSQMMITSGTTPWIFVQIILYIIPNVLAITLPIALLIGTVSCFSRLSSDNEVIALKSCGVSVGRLLRPVVWLAVLCFLFDLALSVYIAPAANAKLMGMQYDIALANLTTEIQPRIFNDKLQGYVFYIDDVEPETMTWKGLFISDRNEPDVHRVYMAQRGKIYYNSALRKIQLHMENGLIHEIAPAKAENDKTTWFSILDIPVLFRDKNAEEGVGKRNIEKSKEELEKEIESGHFPPYHDLRVSVEIEYYRRFSIPFACLVFGIIGVPLGISTRKGGRSLGFVFCLLVILLYYLTFVYLWKAGVHYRLFPVKYGVWGANLIFSILTVVLLRLANRDHDPIEKLLNSRLSIWLEKFWSNIRDIFSRRKGITRRPAGGYHPAPSRVTRVLDRFILKEFITVVLITTAGALSLFTILTLFEIIDEIYTNHISWATVFEYFVFIWPMVLQLVLPLCLLISLLICFGLLEKSNQIMALKACGISLYRLSAPVVLAVALLAGGIFFLQETILPYSNQRQAQLRDRIKGKKVQTNYLQENTWILGRDDRLFNFGYFDPKLNQFADFIAYRIHFQSAQLQEILYARQATWDQALQRWQLEDGWTRVFRGQRNAFQPFRRHANSITENPDYFKKEVKTADKMSFTELWNYIGRLRQGGFNTLSLEVDLHAKLAYPMINLIILLIGLPFSFMMGKRGALFGMTVSILIGISFWALFNLFTAMGGAGIIPPVLAAWAPNIFFAFAGLYLVLNLRT